MDKDKLKELAETWAKRYTASGLKTVTAESILADWEALDKDFNGTLEVDAHAVQVTTTPIVLEGVDFGRFRLTYTYRTFVGSQPIVCLALEPNPYPTKSYVVHPYIEHGEMCYGAANYPMGEGLRRGNLYEPFLCVLGVLTTYSGDHTYGNLELWTHPPCWNCAASTRGAQKCRCGRPTCEACTKRCACGTYICHVCTVNGQNGKPICISCARTFVCQDCGKQKPYKERLKCRCQKDMCTECAPAGVCGGCRMNLCSACTKDSVMERGARRCLACASTGKVNSKKRIVAPTLQAGFTVEAPAPVEPPKRVTKTLVKPKRVRRPRAKPAVTK